MRPGVRRLLPRLGVLAVVLSVAGYATATHHVRTVTGRPDAAAAPCLRCHGVNGPVVYAEGAPHADPRLMAVAPAGDLTLVAACGPAGALAVIDVAARQLTRHVPLDGHPRGVVFSPDGLTVAVSLEDRDAVSLLDRATWAERARVPVGRDPAGLVFSQDGKRLFVANRRTSDVSVVGVAEARELMRVDAGREPYSVALSPDGRTVAVASRMCEIGPAEDEPASLLTLLDAATGTVRRRVLLPSCHMAEDLAFTRDGTRVLVPAVRVKNLLPIVQVARNWVMGGVLVSVETATGAIAILPLGDVDTCHPDPSGIAVSTDGTRAWIASGGADMVCEIDVAAALACEDEARPDMPERLAMATRYVARRISVGDNPRDVVMIGDEVAVAARLDDAIVFFDQSGNVTARVAAGPPIAEDAIRTGERVFHDASFAFQGAFSCRSCHPDGHTDGLTYDFDIDGVGRNILLNRSLRGVKETAPFKWAGTNPTIHRQCGARFAMVLTRADVFPDDDLDALVTYIESLPPPRPDPGAGRVDGRATGAQERGRALFERAVRKDGSAIPPEGRCVTCHPPPHYTNRLTADVGTGSPTDTRVEFDVPHLTGIGSKAPYLHDGRALSLEAIWTAGGVLDQHGVVTDMDKRDLNDLVEFLKGL